MLPGALGLVFNDRKRTLDHHLSKQIDIQGWDEVAPMAVQQFGGAGVDYQQRHGIADEVFGLLSVKARRHRSEERRVGKDWVSTCRSRSSPSHSKKTNKLFHTRKLHRIKPK